MQGGLNDGVSFLLLRYCNTKHCYLASIDNATLPCKEVLRYQHFLLATRVLHTTELVGRVFQNAV